MIGKKNKTYVDLKFKSIFIASTFSMLLEYLMSLTDKILSGNILGADALAAITLVEPFSLVVAFLSCVFSDITGAPVATALGKGDKKKAEQYISQSIIIAVVTGIIITCVYTLFTDKLVYAVAGESQSYTYVQDYFRYLRFVPVPMLLNGVMYLAVLYRGGEKYCNVSAGVSLVSNIGLSILLCFRIGMGGIAIGTVAGLTAGLIPLLAFMFTKQGRIHFYFRVSFKDIKEVIVYSVANSLVYLYLAIFQIAMNAYLVARYADNAIIIFTGVVNVMGLISAMSDGLIEFIVPMINTYRGEDNIQGCKKTIEKAMKASIIEGLIVTFILIFFAGLLVSAFGVTDSSVSREFVTAVRIYAVTIVLYYVVDLYTQYYLYIDRFKQTFIMGLLKGLLLPLLLGVIGGFIFGLNGVWIGMSVSQIALCVGIYVMARVNPEAGRKALFLDEEKLKHQWMWNVYMSESEIMKLIDQVRDVMEEQGIDSRRVNKAALAIEESQICSLDETDKNGKNILECSLLMDNNNDKVTLILRNTAERKNVLEEYADIALEDKVSWNIINRMKVKSRSYILVNGNNRLIFEL